MLNDEQALELYRSQENYLEGLFSNYKLRPSHCHYFRMPTTRSLAEVQREISNSSSILKGQGICHGSLRSRATEVRYSHVITRASPFGDKTLLGATIFFDWLLNRSPWADAFVSKDPKEVIDRGAFLLTTDVSAPLFLGACQMTRLSFSEYKSLFVSICYALQLGYNEDIGMLLWIGSAFGLTVYKNQLMLRPGVVLNSGLSGSNHLPFPGALCGSLKSYKKMLQEGVSQLPTMREEGTWPEFSTHKWNFQVPPDSNKEISRLYELVTKGSSVTFIDETQEVYKPSTPWFSLSKEFTKSIVSKRSGTEKHLVPFSLIELEEAIKGA